MLIFLWRRGVHGEPSSAAWHLAWVTGPTFAGYGRCPHAAICSSAIVSQSVIEKRSLSSNGVSNGFKTLASPPIFAGSSQIKGVVFVLMPSLIIDAFGAASRGW
jgi:hypothetical protein